MSGIAVIDFETTGLYKRDKAVEVGVVLLDQDGNVEGEFATLLNPHRDVSAGDVHRITASDVTHAPTFSDIAAYLAQLLRGRLLVAHNAWFDVTILSREFTRCGTIFPTAIPAVCTMRMASELLGEVRTLELACEYLSVPYTDGHAALHDAQAAANLFRLFAWDLGQPDQLAGAGTFYWEPENDVGRMFSEYWDLKSLLGKADTAWPAYPPTPVPHICTRGDAALYRQQADTRLATLIERMPASTPSTTPAADGESVEYLALLDQVLLDRLITDSEATEIAGTAASLGLTPATLEVTHRRYLERLVHAALRDGIITDSERHDLTRVCTLLNLPGQTVTDLLDTPTADTHHPASPVTLHPGDRVTFTGTTSPPRKVLERLAENAGLEVGGLSKKSRMLIIADPNSESGKARKARDYRVPVVAEQVFLYALDDLLAMERNPS